MTKKASSELKAISKWSEIIDTYFNTILDDLHMIRDYVFNNSAENQICYPINLFRLINNAKNTFNLKTSSVSDLNPIYIIN